jgi:GNAT superfamily N-acetyltransferase
MQIQSAKASEISGLAAFYRLAEYSGLVNPADLVVYAKEQGRIIGAGRLSEEEGVLVLRGMRVLKQHQGRGVGRAILGLLVEEGRSRDCYCIPYRSLQHFYAAEGFHKIASPKAPGFLGDRLKDYRARGHDVILMSQNQRCFNCPCPRNRKKDKGVEDEDEYEDEDETRDE